MMVIPFSFSNSVHNCFDIKAEARAIETGRGVSAVLTLEYRAQDGDALKTEMINFDPKSNCDPYALAEAINQISSRYAEIA